VTIPTPPPLRAGRLARELAGMGAAAAGLLLRAPSLARQPRGGGTPVLVVPGFGAGDGSTALLRSYLGWLGYRVRGWGLGRNRGNVGALIPRVTELVAARAQEEGQPLRLVGWSLGGYLVREAAREQPEAVARIVTFGSPVVGGPKYTATAEAYRRRGHDLDAIEAEVAVRDRAPITVPITAIYSRNDGVVAWQACIDRSSPQVEHVEVRSTHLGLGVDPEVFRIVAERLAPGWKPEGGVKW
jgi:pimeloyl-ACP methyl ester carboxylesterase